MKKVEKKVIESKKEENKIPVATAEEKSNPAGTKKTLILIGSLGIITLILLVLALAPNLKLNLPFKTAPTPTPYVSPAHTTLDIIQPATSTSSSLMNSDIVINTGTNKVAAVQLEILYTSKTLTQVDIKAGTFFNDPVILSKKIDPLGGRITYILAVGLGQKPVSGKGTLATITFSKTAGAAGQAGIVFLPQTGVSASGEITSVLKTATNAIFSLTSPTPVK
jgi:hypothetical protein